MSYSNLVKMLKDVDEFVDTSLDRVDGWQVAYDQLNRVRERTAAGVGIDGAAFKPLKDGSTPTVIAQSTFDKAEIDSSSDAASLSFSGTTRAMVARNDELRPCWGISESERDLIAHQALKMVTGSRS